MFDEAIRGPADAAKVFWDTLADTSMVKDHPALPQRRRPRIIPLGLHGDAGAFTKQDSLLVLSWNSLIGGGHGFARRFVFAIVRKTDLTPETLDTLWTVFAWSMNALLTGVAPEEDWDGRALASGGEYIAGGFRGALVQVRGDWEFNCQIFKFPYWHESSMMCWQCRASNTILELLWSDAGPAAGWRRTRWSHAEYVEHLRARSQKVPILLSLVIGLTLSCVMVDVLHTIDLGLAAHDIGNVFWRCVTLKVFGAATNGTNAHRLGQELNSWYNSVKEKSKLQGKLTIARIRTERGWPKLKCKGAAARHLA